MAADCSVVGQFERDKTVKAITAYKQFPDRSHWTCGQDGWEKVADFALDWALNPTAIQA